MVFGKKTIVVAFVLLAAVFTAYTAVMAQRISALERSLSAYITADVRYKQNVVRLLELNYAQQRALTHTLANSTQVLQAVEISKETNRGRVEPYRGVRGTKALRPYGIGGSP